MSDINFHNLTVNWTSNAANDPTSGITNVSILNGVEAHLTTPPFTTFTINSSVHELSLPNQIFSPSANICYQYSPATLSIPILDKTGIKVEIYPNKDNNDNPNQITLRNGRYSKAYLKLLQDDNLRIVPGTFSLATYATISLMEADTATGFNFPSAYDTKILFYVGCPCSTTDTSVKLSLIPSDYDDYVLTDKITFTIDSSDTGTISIVNPSSDVERFTDTSTKIYLRLTEPNYENIILNWTDKNGVTNDADSSFTSSLTISAGTITPPTGITTSIYVTFSTTSQRRKLNNQMYATSNPTNTCYSFGANTKEVAISINEKAKLTVDVYPNPDDDNKINELVLKKGRYRKAYFQLTNSDNVDPFPASSVALTTPNADSPQENVKLMSATGSYSLTDDTRVEFYIGYACTTVPDYPIDINFTITEDDGDNNDYALMTAVSITSVENTNGILSFSSPAAPVDRNTGANTFDIIFKLSDPNIEDIDLIWTDKVGVTNVVIISPNTFNIPANSLIVLTKSFILSSSSQLKTLSNQVFVSTIIPSNNCFEINSFDAELSIPIISKSEIQIKVYPNAGNDNKNENSLVLMKGRYTKAYFKLTNSENIFPISTVFISLKSYFSQPQTNVQLMPISRNYEVSSSISEISFFIGYACTATVPSSKFYINFLIRNADGFINKDFKMEAVEITSVDNSNGKLFFKSPVNPVSRNSDFSTVDIDLTLSEPNINAIEVTWNNKSLVSNVVTLANPTLNILVKTTQNMTWNFSLSSNINFRKLPNQIFVPTITSPYATCFEFEAGAELSLPIEEKTKIQIKVYPRDGYDNTNENALVLKKGRFKTVYLKIIGDISPIPTSKISIDHPSIKTKGASMINLPDEYEIKAPLVIGVSCSNTETDIIISMTPTSVDYEKLENVSITFDSTKAQLFINSPESPTDRKSSQSILIFLSEINIDSFTIKFENAVGKNNIGSIQSITVPDNTVTDFENKTSPIKAKFIINSFSTDTTINDQEYVASIDNNCYDIYRKELKIKINSITYFSEGETLIGDTNYNGSTSTGEGITTVDTNNNESTSTGEGITTGDNNNGSTSTVGITSIGGNTSTGETFTESTSTGEITTNTNPNSQGLINTTNYSWEFLGPDFPKDLWGEVEPEIIPNNPRPVIDFPPTGDASIYDFNFQFAYITTRGGFCFLTNHIYALNCNWLLSDLPLVQNPTNEEIFNCPDTWVCGDFTTNPYRKITCAIYPEQLVENKEYPLHFSCIINKFKRRSEPVLIGYLVGNRKPVYVYKPELNTIAYDNNTTISNINNDNFGNGTSTANITISAESVYLCYSQMMMIFILFVYLFSIILV